MHKALKLASKIWDELNDTQAQGVNCIIASRAFLLAKSGSQAMVIAHKALELAQETGDHDTEEQAYDIMAEVQQATSGGLPTMGQMFEAQPIEQQSLDQVVEKKKGLDRKVVTETIVNLAAQSAAEDEVGMDVPLMEAGLDSLSAVAFRNQIMTAMSLKVSASLLFDYPTIRLIVEHLLELSVA